MESNQLKCPRFMKGDKNDIYFSTKNQVLSMILSNLFFAFITNGASYAQ